MIMYMCITFDICEAFGKTVLEKITVFELEKTVFKYFEINSAILLVKWNRGHFDNKIVVLYSHISNIFQNESLNTGRNKAMHCHVPYPEHLALLPLFTSHDKLSKPVNHVL